MHFYCKDKDELSLGQRSPAKQDNTDQIKKKRQLKKKRNRTHSWSSFQYYKASTEKRHCLSLMLSSVLPCIKMPVVDLPSSTPDVSSAAVGSGHPVMLATTPPLKLAAYCTDVTMHLGPIANSSKQSILI